MKIKELLDELSVTGNTIAKIAQDKVGIGEKRLKNALHNAGYEYRNKNPKGWFYAKEGKEPLYQSCLKASFIESKNSLPNAKQSSPDLNITLPRSSQPITLDVKSVKK